MEYHLVTHREVPRLLEQLTTLSNLAFADYDGTPDVDEAFTEWYLRRPGSTPELCVGALHGPELVANVLVAIERLNVGGEFIPCGIVDTVATHPAHRRQGLARRLMDLAHRLMREQGARAAVLYTNPENHPYQFYGRLGYFTRARAGMLTGQRPTAAQQYEVRLARAGEVGAVSKLVNDHYATYEGFARLDEALWRWHRQERPASMPLQVLVAEAAGQTVGTVALAEVEVRLHGENQRVAVLSDAVYADRACLQDLLARAPQERLMALQALASPERDDLEGLGFATSAGEVAMILPFDDGVRALMHNAARPWYVMVESVVGV